MLIFHPTYHNNPLVVTNKVTEAPRCSTVTTLIMSGLEALGVAASIIQVADIGFQLSKNIYNYADTAASTDERLARIAKNVDLTTEVVSRVAEVFSEQEKGRKVVSQQALRLGRDVAVECEEVFGRLMGEVGKLQQ